MKNLLIYIVTALLIYFVISHYITSEQIELLQNVSLFQIAISILIALMIFTVSGNQFSYILFKSTKTKLSIPDRIGFPTARNLWSYIIPFQGSFAYSLAFIKFKYKVNLKDGLSINIYLLLFNFFFTGLVGIYYSLQSNSLPVLFLIISISLLSIPLLLLLFDRVLKNIKTPEFKILKFLIDNLSKVSTGITILWKDLKFTAYVFLFNVIHTIVTIIWFYWTVHIFNLDIDIISVIFLALILKISLIFRLTPGNLGVEQLIYGGIFALMNYDPKIGVLISLFHKSITIIISLTVGSLFTFINFKYFSFSTILNFLKQQDQRKNEPAK
ncbi:MAG: flippase-like domain-containing protein [Candidatus Delongbacteria bacterium]|nr:flippase-like domain-containing protein [Candidatus Delongbacteria bacterium]